MERHRLHGIFRGFSGAHVLHAFSINRFPLVISYLVTFTCTVALRAFIMRHHLPFETLFWGTLSSPAFLLFAFFMITDPKTSPSNRREQVWVGIALALADLSYHLRQSYYTFFYAAFTIACTRYAFFHLRDAFKTNPLVYFKNTFFVSGYYKKLLALASLALLGFRLVQNFYSSVGFCQRRARMEVQKKSTILKLASMANLATFTIKWIRAFNTF